MFVLHVHATTSGGVLTVFLTIYVGHHQKTPESVGRCRSKDAERLDAAVSCSGHRV